MLTSAAVIVMISHFCRLPIRQYSGEVVNTELPAAILVKRKNVSKVYYQFVLIVWIYAIIRLVISLHTVFEMELWCIQLTHFLYLTDKHQYWT